MTEPDPTPPPFEITEREPDTQQLLIVWTQLIAANRPPPPIAICRMTGLQS